MSATTLTKSSSTGANDQHHRRRQDHTMAHAAQEKDQESDF